MSMEIEGREILAVSLSEFLDDLKEGVEVEIPISREGIYIVMDRKFDTLCEKKMPERFKNSEYSTGALIAKAGYFADNTTSGIFDHDQFSVFRAVIAMASGIDDPVFFDDKNKLLRRLAGKTLALGGAEYGIDPIKENLIILPHKIVNFFFDGCPLKDGLAMLLYDDVLQSLVKGLAEKNLLTVIPGITDDYCERPVRVGCLKSAINSLLERTGTEEYNNRAEKQTWQTYTSMTGDPFYWIESLIKAYIFGQISELCDIKMFAVSDYAYSAGDMDRNQPYISLGGDGAGYDLTSKKDRDYVNKIKEALFGRKSKKKFSIFEFQQVS